MGYLHIDNLYANQTILLFKQCYALEKIHGTSAHISWRGDKNSVRFFTGGSYPELAAMFDVENLTQQFSKLFGDKKVIIYGEHYGGKEQGMSQTYGELLRFAAFDVKVGELWLDVPKAEAICRKLEIPFVDYTLVSTDLDALNFERDKDSVQAILNGMGAGKLREGVVLRPLVELRLNNGNRVICKHKRDEFRETKTPRIVSPETLQVLTDAAAIADEWVTPMRLNHVLGKLPEATTIRHTKAVIEAMIADVEREGRNEILQSHEVRTAIGRATALLFHERLKHNRK